jgi:hypothetical protein
VWRTCFGNDYGRFVRQTTEWMNNTATSLCQVISLGKLLLRQSRRRQKSKIEVDLRQTGSEGMSCTRLVAVAVHWILALIFPVGELLGLLLNRKICTRFEVTTAVLMNFQISGLLLHVDCMQVQTFWRTMPPRFSGKSKNISWFVVKHVNRSWLRPSYCVIRTKCSTDRKSQTQLCV